jgi:hypothetical protein
MKIFDTEAAPWRTRILAGVAVFAGIVLVKWLFG